MDQVEREIKIKALAESSTEFPILRRVSRKHVCRARCAIETSVYRMWKMALVFQKPPLLSFLSGEKGFPCLFHVK